MFLHYIFHIIFQSLYVFILYFSHFMFLYYILILVTLCCTEYSPFVNYKKVFFSICYLYQIFLSAIFNKFFRHNFNKK